VECLDSEKNTETLRW